MKLEQEFEVDAPVDRVWAALIDVERVAPNLPGAAVTGRNEDGTYNGTFAVKIGPTSVNYSGKLEMVSVDEASHTATMNADGSDTRGQGGAKATITSSVTATEAGGTKVTVISDYRLTGRLARFGRGGMIEDVSEKLLRQFASSLQASLAQVDGGAASAAEVDGGAVSASDGDGGAEPEVPATAAEAPPVAEPAAPPPAPEPFDAGAAVADVALSHLRANPWPVVAVVVVALVLLLIGRRRVRSRAA
jgi:carbon monoxide dehydrogenase subunit G